MCGKNLVLCQDAVDRASQAGCLRLFGDIAVDVVHGKIGADPLTDFPAINIRTKRDELSSHIGAWDRVFLLIKRELALGHDEVAVLGRWQER